MAGKAIAVTGASRGIGAAIAAELARRGHTVGCLSRKGAGIEEGALADELRARCIDIVCDIDREDSIRAALATFVGKAGRLDGLVNNAGRLYEGRSEDCSTADFEAVLHTNLVGTFVMCREAYPHLVANGGGLIVNIGSFFDRIGARYTAAYGASKAGIGALTRALAVEWARKKIRLIDVAPGVTATELNRPMRERDSFRAYMRKRIPAGDFGDPAEVARLVAVLLQEDLPYLTGETIYIDGAISISQ